MRDYNPSDPDSIKSLDVWRALKRATEIENHETADIDDQQNDQKESLNCTIRGAITAFHRSSNPRVHSNVITKEIKESVNRNRRWASAGIKARPHIKSSKMCRSAVTAGRSYKNCNIKETNNHEKEYHDTIMSLVSAKNPNSSYNHLIQSLKRPKSENTSGNTLDRDHVRTIPKHKQKFRSLKKKETPRSIINTSNCSNINFAKLDDRFKWGVYEPNLNNSTKKFTRNLNLPIFSSDTENMGYISELYDFLHGSNTNKPTVKLLQTEKYKRASRRALQAHYQRDTSTMVKRKPKEITVHLPSVNQPIINESDLSSIKIALRNGLQTVEKSLLSDLESLRQDRKIYNGLPYLLR